MRKEIFPYIGFHSENCQEAISLLFSNSAAHPGTPFTQTVNWAFGGQDLGVRIGLIPAPFSPSSTDLSQRPGDS